MLHGGGGFVPPTIACAVEELDRADGQAAERLASEGARLALAAGFEAEPLPAKEEHKTWRTLLGEAGRHDAKLVVVGAHGLSGAAVCCSGVCRARLWPIRASPCWSCRWVLVRRPGMDPCCSAATGPTAPSTQSGRPAIWFVAAVRWFSTSGNRGRGSPGASGTVRTMALGLDEIAERESVRVSEEGRATAQTAGFEARSVSRYAEAPVWRAVLDAADEESAAITVVGSRGLTGSPQTSAASRMGWCTTAPDPRWWCQPLPRPLWKITGPDGPDSPNARLSPWGSW